MTKQQLTNEIKSYMEILERERARVKDLADSNERLFQESRRQADTVTRLKNELRCVRGALRGISNIANGMETIAHTAGGNLEQHISCEFNVNNK